MKRFLHRSAWPVSIGLIVLLLIWGFASGWLVYTGRSLRVKPWTMPAGGPTVDVHPEVLNLQASFSNVAERVKPAVVSISTVRMEEVPASQFFFGDPFERFDDNPSRRRGAPRKQKAEGMGSGVVIDPDGLVLTNDHVLQDADDIKVILYDADGRKKDYKATVVGKDARTDLAVVRIHTGHKLPHAALGNSEQVKVGDWAIAIGSPFGLAQTVTVGVISAARQSLQIEDREYHNLIQTDAAINRGNSGGPLLNIRGEVVGINSAIYAPTGVFAGIGFAVPINQAKVVVDELIKKGKVTRGWLGVELGREISPAMVKQFGLPDDQGALVNDVMKDTPASRAGFHRGDVIRSFNGKPVTSAAQLQTLVSETPPGRSVPIEVIRDRQKKMLTLQTGERPESADRRGSRRAKPEEESRPSDSQLWLGVRVLTLTPDLSSNFRQPEDAKGVVVVEVESGSVGEDIGLAAGDVIRRINQTATPTLPVFRKTTTGLNLSDGVVLDVLRQGRALFLSYTKE